MSGGVFMYASIAIWEMGSTVVEPLITRLPAVAVDAPRASAAVTEAIVRNSFFMGRFPPYCRSVKAQRLLLGLC